jgi:uncharacterized protein
MPARPAPLSDADLDRLEHLLSSMAERHEAVPELEQLDGFLAALACGPRRVALDEVIPALLGEPAPFADETQRRDFLDLAGRRFAEVARALDAPVQRLDDERALSPLLTDWQAVREQVPEAQRGAAEDWPRLGAVWAGGFLQCVESFEDDWLLQADDPGNEFVEGCLQLFEILASDEAEMPPEARAMSVDERLADALWAVYDLRDFWRERASRRPVATVRKVSAAGRNDPCPCGSGKKFKKCHGAPGGA